MTFSEETVQQVGLVLLDENKPLHERFRALFTLKNMGGDTAVKSIGKCFSDPSALLRHELAYVLGQMQNLEAIPILTEVLENLSENAMVRHEAAEALGALGLTSSLPILEKYINDPEKVVSETCQIAVDKIKFEEMKKNLSNDSEFDPNPYASVDPAPPLPKTTCDELVQTLLDENLSLFERYRAMFSLRNRGDEESVLGLAKGLKASSALFRHEIAFVLGQMAHPAAVDALAECLEQQGEHEMVRHECAEALGAIADEKALPYLTLYSNDPQLVVKQSCQVALDMYNYEKSQEFQYADTISKVDNA